MDFKEYNQNTSKKRNLILYVVLVIVLSTTAFGSGFLYTTIKNKGKKNSSSYDPNVNSSLIKNAPTPTPTPSFLANPINGTLIESSRYYQRREQPPLAVIIQNNTASRPSWGLNEADMVYETVAEGGITRFMGVYWSKDAERVMSVRSARKYFVDMLGDYNNVVFMHEGFADGSENVSAIKAINKNGVRSLGFGGGALLRDADCGRRKAVEHCAYSTTNLMWDIAKKKNWSGDISKLENWKFKDFKETDLTGLKDLTDFTVNFGGLVSQSYSVNWKYDKASGFYKRYNLNGTPFVDNAGVQVTTDTVIYQQIVSFPANDDKNHMVQEVIGNGKGYIMQNGKVYSVTWKKPDFKTRTRFYLKENGEEFVFKRGKIWNQLISNTVEYKDNAPVQSIN